MSLPVANTKSSWSASSWSDFKRNPEEAAREGEPRMQVYGPNAQCVTDKSLGKDSTLRWRFRERSLLFFEDPEGAKTAIQELLGAAVLAWGGAAPIKFAYGEDNWDFEIGVRWASDCTICPRLVGCSACKPLEQEA